MKRIVLTITSLGSSGEGVGSHQGLKIFVEGALPGEEVEVELLTQKKNYATAKLLSILSSSPQRKTPLCPLFGECGGCQLMHLNSQGQLASKTQRVKDAFERIGGFKTVSVSDCIASPHELHYRNKIQFPILWNHNQPLIGLYRKQSHTIVPVEKCYIQQPLGEKILTTFRSLSPPSCIRFLIIRNTLHTKESHVLFVTDGTQSSALKKLAQALMEKEPSIQGVSETMNNRTDNVVLGSDFRLLNGRDFIEEQLLDKKLRFSAAAFFQVNPWQAENIYKTALKWACLRPSDRVLDAFCGVGLFSLFSSSYVKETVGIEYVSRAIDDAKENAKLNGLKNCTFHCGPSEELALRFFPFDVIFLNPPRKGCSPLLLDKLKGSCARTLLYLSCDPATLARDAKILVENGFSIERIQPFDMFPQTAHVETLVLFQKNAS